YQTLLEGIVADPDQRISRLPLLTSKERRQILVEWNSTQKDFPKGSCLQQLFEAQVERTPNAHAVVFEAEALTYREVNERANRIARLMRQAGIGKGDFVAILEERSPAFLIDMLAIFKAGAAYVPIDPNYPNDRVQYLLTKSEVRTLLTRSSI